MKKIISGLAGLVLAGNVAMAENIGDKMPEFWGRQLNGSFGPYDSGVMISLAPYVDKNDNIISPNNYEYAFAVSTAKGCEMMTPFAVFSYKTREIYHDFNGDGTIDMIIKYGTIEHGEKMIKSAEPNCKLLEEQKKLGKKKVA